MNSEKRTYYKCGEIYLVDKNESYTFLCYYCDEIFLDFLDFRAHIINCSTVLNTSDIQKSSKDFQIESNYKSAHTVFYRESKMKLSDNCLESEKILRIQENCKQKKRENCTKNIISTDKYSNNCNLDDENLKNSSTSEEFCPHCNISHKLKSHDVKKCSRVQYTITKYNGDFIKLLHEGILYCYQCKTYFEDYEILYEHHIKAEHCKHSQCAICKFYAFMNSKINLNKQKKNAPNEKQNLKENIDQSSIEIDCGKCLNKFISKAEYDLHMQINHKQSIQSKINDCEYKYEKHTVSCESGQREFNCSFCKKMFKYKSNLKNHLKIHTNDRPHKCKFCPSAFTIARNLRNHIVYKHTSDRPFACEYEGCNGKFKLLSLKKQHERRHRPRNFQCEICGNYFLNNSSLLSHQLIHKDPKSWPFQCELCQKRFTVHTRYAEHKRRMHTEERPFGCEICPKFFKSRKDLREHKKLHSDKKNYTCRICNKGFKQHAGYYSHIKYASCYNKIS